MPRALWKATYDESFCERRAAEFAAQLQAWGWRCNSERAEQGRIEERNTKDTLLPKPE